MSCISGNANKEIKNKYYNKYKYMPMNPLRPCRYPGCNQLTKDNSGYCIKHQDTGKVKQKARNKRYDKTRPSANKRGYDARWQRYRKRFLADNPLCIQCLKNGIIKAASVVDHIEPHRGDMVKFWDVSNHNALCKRCHDVKTFGGK